jgi:hypothetical protein
MPQPIPMLPGIGDGAIEKRYPQQNPANFGQADADIKRGI